MVNCGIGQILFIRPVWVFLIPSFTLKPHGSFTTSKNKTASLLKPCNCNKYNPIYWFPGPIDCKQCKIILPALAIWRIKKKIFLEQAGGTDMSLSRTFHVWDCNWAILKLGTFRAQVLKRILADGFEKLMFLSSFYINSRDFFNCRAFQSIQALLWVRKRRATEISVASPSPTSFTLFLGHHDTIILRVHDLFFFSFLCWFFFFRNVEKPHQ